MIVFTVAHGTEWNCDYDYCLFTLRGAAQAKAHLQTSSVANDNGNWQILQHNNRELNEAEDQVEHLPSGARAEMARVIFDRRQARIGRERQEAIWSQTPIYRYFATGGSRSLMTDEARWVHDNLLSMA